MVTTSNIPHRISPHTSDAVLRKGLETVINRLYSYMASGTKDESIKPVIGSLIEMLKSLSPDYGASLSEKMAFFIQTVNEMLDATDSLLDGANEAVKEIRQELETLVSTRARVLDTVLIARVDAAIKIRESAVQRADLVINGNGGDNVGYQATRDEMVRELKALEHGAYENEEDARRTKSILNKRIKAIETSIDAEVSTINKCSSEIERLYAYKSALMIAAGEPPEELLDQKK
jgi:hypothetical protein